VAWRLLSARPAGNLGKPQAPLREAPRQGRHPKSTPTWHGGSLRWAPRQSSRWWPLARTTYRSSTFHRHRTALYVPMNWREGGDIVVIQMLARHGSSYFEPAERAGIQHTYFRQEFEQRQVEDIWLRGNCASWGALWRINPSPLTMIGASWPMIYCFANSFTEEASRQKSTRRGVTGPRVRITGRGVNCFGSAK